jgi:hypothetical protein
LADLIFAEMYEKLGRPPLIFVDMRPVSKPVALITSHDIAEQVVKSSTLFPWSTPKTPTMKDIIHLLGSSSLISAEVRFVYDELSTPILTPSRARTGGNFESALRLALRRAN